MIIKIILLIAIVLLFFKLLSRRKTARTQAGKKILLVVLMLVAIISVLYPEFTNWLARLVDVGRGADLLLYCLAIAFFFHIINDYAKSRDERRTIVKIVRAQSILEAQNRYYK